MMEGESGDQVGGELESVKSSADCFMQGWRNETGTVSWYSRFQNNDPDTDGCSQNLTIYSPMSFSLDTVCVKA